MVAKLLFCVMGFFVGGSLIRNAAEAARVTDEKRLGGPLGERVRRQDRWVFVAMGVVCLVASVAMSVYLLVQLIR